MNTTLCISSSRIPSSCFAKGVGGSALPRQERDFQSDRTRSGGGEERGQQINGQVGCFLLKRLEHEELLEDLGLTGLPDLSSQEHLVHHRVHLKVSTKAGH